MVGRWFVFFNSPFSWDIHSFGAGNMFTGPHISNIDRQAAHRSGDAPGLPQALNGPVDASEIRRFCTHQLILCTEIVPFPWICCWGDCLLSTMVNHHEEPPFGRFVLTFSIRIKHANLSYPDFLYISKIAGYPPWNEQTEFTSLKNNGWFRFNFPLVWPIFRWRLGVSLQGGSSARYLPSTILGCPAGT